jgi:hypothetical protein
MRCTEREGFIGPGSDLVNDVKRRVGSHLGGRDLPVRGGAVVHLDCRLLYGGFDGWSCSPVQMRPRDGGLVAHGVRAIRNDDAAQWLLQESGRQALSQFYFLQRHFCTVQFMSIYYF